MLSKNKERRHKITRQMYQDIFEEEKNEKHQYAQEQYRNPSDFIIIIRFDHYLPDQEK